MVLIFLHLKGQMSQATWIPSSMALPGQDLGNFMYEEKAIKWTRIIPHGVVPAQG